MQIDKDELKSLILEIQNQQKTTDKTISDTNINSMFDSITKILITIIAAGILWLVNTTGELQKENSINRVFRDNIKEDLQELKDFTKEPRFTRQDFITETQSLKLLVDRHDAQLSARDLWARAREQELNNALNDIKQIKEKMDE